MIILLWWAPVIAAIISAAGSIGGSLLSSKGGGAGGDDLKKLMKDQLKPDPMDEIGKQQQAALREYLFIRSLIEMQEDRALRDDRLRLAGFEPKEMTIPFLYGPSIVQRSEKGPDKLINIPGGMTTYVPGLSQEQDIHLQGGKSIGGVGGVGGVGVQQQPPQSLYTDEWISFIAPILLALRRPIINTNVNDLMDTEITRRLETGEITPFQAQSREYTTRNIGIPYRVRRKGKDITGILPPVPQNVPLESIPKYVEFDKRDSRASELLNLLKVGATPEQIYSYVRTLGMVA